MSDFHHPDWPLVRISDFAEINIGGTPSRAAPQFWATKPEGNPWIAISDLKGKYIDDTKEYITDLGAKCSNVKLIEPFTTVMSFKLTVGRAAITARPMYCNEAIAIFSPKNDALNGGWLYHALPRAALSVVTDNAVKGATLNKAKMAEMTVQLPPITEQRKIAQILDTLDTAILETEALIDKLKAVKQGLLHDLLTRGIDANGQLRPPQSEAPQLYKESPLGWIPREWDVVRVGEDVDIEHGFAFPGHQFTDKEVGPALLVPGNFHREGGLYFTPENTKYFSGKYPQQYVLSHGDVLVVMTDLSPMTLILGRTAVLTENFKVLHNQRIGKFRFKKDGLWNSAFFAEALNQDAVRLKVIAEATGTTVRHTSPSRIKSCHVARPKLQEQNIAAQQIATADARLKLEGANLLKQRQTKSGLMDDLLTGRVRVTPLLESVQQAAAPTGA